MATEHEPSRATRHTISAACAATLLVSASLAADPESLVFTDVTAVAGVALSGELNESVAWGDYDNDGDQDLYLTVDGPNRLFRNDGGDTFTDVSAQTGTAHQGFSVGAAFGDLDNDGDLDLYVVSFSSGPDALFRNDGPVGAGEEYVFTDVSAQAGVALDETSSRGVALIDLDRDGLLDVYVNAIGPDLLYHNDGGLRVTNIASAIGLGNEGLGVGVVATDIDNDGWVDLFTGNRSFDPNRLYVNDKGLLDDITIPAGIVNVGVGMGVLAFDYDNDLDMDLYWTTWPGTEPDITPNALYENLGDHSFADVTLSSATGDVTGWGISCNAGDVDNDGWQDFFVTNGASPDSTANVLFHNQGDGTFSDATTALGRADFDGRGVAFADYDGDGDLDLCVTGGGDADTRLWRNDTPTAGHWLTLHLVGVTSNRSAIGSRVEVRTAAGTQAKEVSGGAGRGSQNSLPLEFGLGTAASVEEITVRWPSGLVQVHEDIAADQALVVIEAAAIFADGFESGSASAWPGAVP